MRPWLFDVIEFVESRILGSNWDLYYHNSLVSEAKEYEFPREVSVMDAVNFLVGIEASCARYASVQSGCLCGGRC